jgi:hypothetical protein
MRKIANTGLKRCPSCGCVPSPRPRPQELRETITRYREHNDRLEASLRASVAIVESPR